jgi:hypothetical protein
MSTFTSVPASAGSPSRRGVDAIPPDVGTAPDGPHTLRVVPWPDAVIDTLGHDPRSWYVEQFWLPVIGPTSTWLLRRLVAGLDGAPDGFDLDLDDTARALGLGGRSGRHSPFQRAVGRCITFGHGRHQGPGTLGVRRRLPPLPLRHLQRLPTSLQQLHAQWSDMHRRTPTAEESRQRARRLALWLLEIEEDPPIVEIQLMRRGVHPALAHESAAWAANLGSGAHPTPANDRGPDLPA